MKVTGIIVMAIGLVGLLFAAFMAAQTNARAPFDLTLPLAAGVAALIGGALLTAFGGRGYVTTNNPALRN